MRNGLVTLVLVVGTAALLYLFLFNDTEPESIPYSGTDTAFLDRVEAGEVESVLARGEALVITLIAKDENGETVVVESWLPAQFTTSVQADMAVACEAGAEDEQPV